jgi:hypothetical protein
MFAVVLRSQLQHLIASNSTVTFCCCANLNIYDSSQLTALATQAVAGRQLHVTSSSAEIATQPAVQIKLCEDDYPGWIAAEDFDLLEISDGAYHPHRIHAGEIRDRIPRVIQYTYIAMRQTNYYLWGGTVGPNYDCSGLMQAAFLSVGVWIPRDAYQQHAFTHPIPLELAEPGDLVFFGNDQRITHVGLYLGDRRYIHSSGREIGRNGIGIDELSETAGEVSQAYFKQFKGVGRVMHSYP